MMQTDKQSACQTHKSLIINYLKNTPFVKSVKFLYRGVKKLYNEFLFLRIINDAGHRGIARHIHYGTQHVQRPINTQDERQALNWDAH